MPKKNADANRVAEEWGTWEGAERASHAAFRQRSPRDRLAWLEDLLRLRDATLAMTRRAGQPDE